MVDAPKFVPARQDWTYPLPVTPNYYPELPYHLRKYVLKGVAEENDGASLGDIWNQRGIYIEIRVKDILTSLPEVAKVIRHEKGSEEDAAGHDLTITFKDSRVVYVQVKSSGDGIMRYKRAIRNNYFPNEQNNEGQVNRWMTKNNVILINGSETRSREEIIYDSFYPQLERIVTGNQTLRETTEDTSRNYSTLPASLTFFAK